MATDTQWLPGPDHIPCCPAGPGCRLCWVPATPAQIERLRPYSEAWAQQASAALKGETSQLALYATGAASKGRVSFAPAPAKPRRNNLRPGAWSYSKPEGETVDLFNAVDVIFPAIKRAGQAELPALAHGPAPEEEEESEPLGGMLGAMLGE